MRRLFLFLLILTGSLSGMAEQKNARLFRIERSINQNIVCYDANLKNGLPDRKDPIDSYWSQLNNPKDRSEITMFDAIAFGYKVKYVSDKEYLFTLRASSKKTFKMCQYKGKWVATTDINGHEAQVTKLYVKMKTKLTADYLDIYGVDLATGQQVKERLKK